jgi:hypothetical protein
MHELLQHGIRMSPIYNGTIGFGIVPTLRAKLRSEKLVNFSGTSMQAETDFGNVRNCRFDTISGSFDLFDPNKTQLQ